MRVLLLTGKGGVGKTTVAAATAALAAQRGLKTLVLSTDAAPSLGDALGVTAGPEPTWVDGGLHVQHVNPRRRFVRSWGQVQRWLVAVLDAAGVGSVAAEELTVLPGVDEVLALLEVRAQVRSGDWDLVVVDCAPTGETLRLLALPEALAVYIDRAFPVERRVARALRPALSRVSRLPETGDDVLGAVLQLRADLADARAVLADAEAASVRLVLTPESLVLAEARRTLTTLSLYGYRVDGVVANRVLPDGGDDPWRAGWVRSQRAVLAEAEASFAPLPVRRAGYRESEPVGLDALVALGRALYGDEDPAAMGPAVDPVIVEPSGAGFVLVQALPLADRGELGLVRHGDELVVSVGPHRRVLALPAALRRCTVEGAALRDGTLRVRFAPDPQQWLHP